MTGRRLGHLCLGREAREARDTLATRLGGHGAENTRNDLERHNFEILSFQ